MINENVMTSFCKHAEEEDGGMGRTLIRTAIGAGIGGALGHFGGPAIGKFIGGQIGAQKFGAIPLIGRPIGKYFGGKKGFDFGTQHGLKIGAGLGAVGGLISS